MDFVFYLPIKYWKKALRKVSVDSMSLSLNPTDKISPGFPEIDGFF